MGKEDLNKEIKAMEGSMRTLSCLPLIVCVLASTILPGCTTFEMRAGDFNSAKPVDTSDKLLTTEQSNQPWYSAVRSNFSYVTFVSSIDTTNADHNIFETLGCRTTPISLSSRQQSFVLTGALQDTPTLAYPLFSFSRTDAQNTCAINTINVTMGPFKVAEDSYSLISVIKASTADTVTADNLYSAVIPLLSTFSGTTPMVGGASAETASTALKDFETYLNNNLTLSIGNSGTLFSVALPAIRTGQLVYAGDLVIHKDGTFGSATIPVGRLVVTIKTSLSLVTPNAPVQMSMKDWQKINADGHTHYDLPWVPDYSQVDAWMALVIPVGQTTSQELGSGIDANNPDSTTHILPKLNALTKDSSASDINSFCSSLRSRLVIMQFDEQDQLAIISWALLHAPHAIEGPKVAPNYATGMNQCFSPSEQVLMKVMNVPTGNDDQKLTVFFRAI